MVSMNALANILPINGMNTGEISGFYPNYFVPAGYTFSIWGIIYLLLTTYAIAFGFYTSKKSENELLRNFLLGNFKPFVETCWLNGIWIICWHYLNMEASLLVMFFLFKVLFSMFMKGANISSTLNKKQQLLVLTPISVYFGWISVATIANITAALVKYQFNPGETIAVFFSAVLILVAGLLGGLLSFKYKAYGYAFSIIWALAGVWVAQHNVSSMLYASPLASMGIVYTGVIAGSLKKKPIKA
jgi:hypothetical protein